ncbi:hypothetical protein TWF506_008351 [Arthrobotrys conoides]|uniref:Uncharacterized protein n=1 Tax=Arthrobotrys conoides TaxID=74498 RepID=A0AAN8RXB7_9PEZI
MASWALNNGTNSSKDCRCVTEMLQPDIDHDIPLSEYQDALNQVPFSVKQQFPGYQWKSPGYEMTWSSMTAGNSYPPENQEVERWLVPGTAEPYYLEGQNQNPAAEWMVGLLPGFKGGNPGSWATSRELSFVKRNSADTSPSFSGPGLGKKYGGQPSDKAP